MSAFRTDERPEFSGPAVAMARAAIDARDLVQVQILGEAMTRFLGLGSFREMVEAIGHGYRPTIRRDMPMDTNGDAYRALADLYDAAQFFRGNATRCYPEGCECHLINTDDACNVCQHRAGRFGRAS